MHCEGLGTLAVVQVDTEVQDAAVYRFGDLPETLTAKGRGGTDFRPGFAWLAQEGITPDCCLYLTDMACDRYPETPPPFPVLWCSWGPALHLILGLPKAGDNVLQTLSFLMIGESIPTMNGRIGKVTWIWHKNNRSNINRIPVKFLSYFSTTN